MKAECKGNYTSATLTRDYLNCCGTFPSELAMKPPLGNFCLGTFSGELLLGNSTRALCSGIFAWELLGPFHLETYLCSAFASLSLSFEIPFAVFSFCFRFAFALLSLCFSLRSSARVLSLGAWRCGESGKSGGGTG